jgi:hypothetical protein
MGGYESTGQSTCVQPDQRDHHWNVSLCFADPESPAGNAVFLHSVCCLLIKHGQPKAENGLDDLLDDDVAENVPSRHVVALHDLGGSV